MSLCGSPCMCRGPSLGVVTVWGIRVGNQGVHSAMSTLSEMVLSSGYDLK